MEFILSKWDYFIVAIYFVGVMIHGYYAGRGKHDSDSYFLAGRKLPWGLIGFSLYSSNMSGASFVGLMGASYAHGVVVFNYEWTATIVLIFFGFFILPYFLKGRVATVPEFLEKRYDKRSRKVYSAFTILAILFIDTAGALYAGGLVISAIIPLSLWQSVAILGIMAGLYTIMGGLSAVVVTDTVQACLLIIGAVAIFWLGMEEVGGWSALMEHFKDRPEMTGLIQPATHDFLPWPGIFGVLLLGFYYWTLNQFIVQRTLGAKNLENGQKGALFAGLLKLPNLFLMIIPGMIGLILYPDLPTPDAVFPALAFDLLPVGFRGLVLTALIAAIMSSLDSALNAGSSLITLDFIKTHHPHISEKGLVQRGKLITALLMVIAIGYAPLIAGFTSLFEYFQSSLSYLIPPVVAVYLTGIFVKGISPKAAYLTILGGLGLGIPLFIFKEITGVWTAIGLPDLHYTYMGSIIFIVACIILLIAKRNHVGAEYVFRISDLRVLKTSPWYGSFAIQSLLVGLLLFTLIVVFW